MLGNSWINPSMKIHVSGGRLSVCLPLNIYVWNILPMEYLALWRLEKDLYRHNLREVKNRKVTLLRGRYSVKQDVPDHVRGISIKKRLER